MVAYTTRVPAGIPGAITRDWVGQAVKGELINTTTPPTAYGAPVKFNANTVQNLAASDAGSVVAGWAIRSYPIQPTSGGPTSALGAVTPPTSGMIDIMYSGYFAATLGSGTAAKGGQVYVITTVGTLGLPLGAVVTSASPGSSAVGVAVTNAFFTSPADANGIVEIAYNI